MDLTHQRRSNLSPEDFAPSSSHGHERHGHERHGHERKGTRSRVPQSVPSTPDILSEVPDMRSAPNPAPTARPILAWGNAPGTAAPQTRGLKARAKRLIPHKLLIECDAILRKHRPHLRLEITPLMMRGLRIDIPHQRRSIAQPNRERRIASLPAKSRKLRPFRLDPLRRRNLHPLHQMRHRFVPCKQQRNVNVVGNSANPNADVLRMIENRSQIRMHLASDRFTQKRPPLLRAEDQMHQHIRERLRHGNKYNAGLQPAPSTAVISSEAPDMRSATVPAPTARPTLAWGNAPGPCIPANSGLKARVTLAWGNAPGPCIPANRGLKARATLAWGNAPGTQTQTICGLKARAIESSIQSVSAPGSALHEMVRRPAANPLIELPEAE
jgi:hypothetical protein